MRTLTMLTAALVWTGAVIGFIALVFGWEDEGVDTHGVIIAGIAHGVGMLLIVFYMTWTDPEVRRRDPEIAAFKHWLKKAKNVDLKNEEEVKRFQVELTEILYGKKKEDEDGDAR